MQDPLGAFVPGTDARLDGAASGPLRGLSFAAKDIFDVAGHVTGWGNPDMGGSRDPADSSAPAVQAWLDAGASLVGKTITDELAYSVNGQNAHHGTPTNSNAPGRIPGGSSSGSAAAVAGGVVDLALGSDTGGSVRIPASYCGIFGLRTTHGRIPLEGVMPLAPSFDTVGWFARDPELLRAAGEVLLGARVQDAPAPRGLVILQDAFELAEDPVRQELAPLVEELEMRFGKADRAVLGEPGGGLREWMQRFRHVQAREVWAQHGPWITETQPRLGPEIAERFAWAKTITAEVGEAALADSESFVQRALDLVQEDRLLCLPTAPGIAPLLSASADELREHRDRVISLTCIAGFAGLPQITMPLGRVSGCPVGLSLIGPRGADMILLSVAESFRREPA